MSHTPGPWVYVQSEPGLWTVGFYGPDGDWNSDSDFPAREQAARRAAFLNGSPDAEMLDALQAVADLKGWSVKPPLGATGIQVMAAIAKATGEPS